MDYIHKNANIHRPPSYSYMFTTLGASTAHCDPQQRAKHSNGSYAWIHCKTFNVK